MVMHIGFLSPEYVLSGQYDGGLANYIHKVAHALCSRGQRVTVFVLSNQDRAWNDGQVRIIEVKVVHTPLVKFPGKPVDSVNAWLPAYDQIRSSRRIAHFVWQEHRLDPFDILQTSNYEVPGFTLRKNGRIPLVCRISSYTPVYRAAYGRQRTLAEYLRDWLEIRQVIDADAAFSPSLFSITLFDRQDAFRPDLIRTPIDFVKVEPDISLYEKELSGLRYLLFFGTMSRMKGVDLIADAIPVILRSHPDTHFVFVGRDDGMPGGMKMTDLILSRNSHQENHIHFIPTIPKPQLYAIISHAVAILMPSRVDNYPNACLEAQMLGIPVIGSRNSSLDEMIEDGKTGFLVDNGNSKELAEAAMKLLDMDEGAYQAMQQANLASIGALGREDRIDQLLTYYKEVVQRFNGKK
jgi:glycosyltransferase involved in cell wall biosynthesis